MNEQRRETTFLRECLRYHDTPERHQLEERMNQLQRKERSVQRAVWLMALLLALAVAGLGYWAIFVSDHPHNMSQFMTPFISKGLCEVGLGAVICLVAFLGLGVIYRKQLERRREECRRMAAEFLEARLSPPSTPSSPPVVNDPPLGTSKESPKANKG